MISYIHNKEGLSEFASVLVLAEVDRLIQNVNCRIMTKRRWINDDQPKGGVGFVPSFIHGPVLSLRPTMDRHRFG